MKIANFKVVHVYYDNGECVPTSMAAGLTDEQIKKYFAIGREFNIGSVTDRMAKVEQIKIE